MKRVLVIVGLAVLVASAPPAAAAAGDELWSHSNHSGNVQDVEATGQYVVSGGYGSNIVDARDHSGTQQWQHSRLSGVQGVGVGGGFVAVINDSGAVDVADISDGSQVSTYSVSGIGRDIVVDESIVAAGTTDNKIKAVDPNTGDELWTTTEPGSSAQGVALTGEYVIAGTQGAELYAFDRSDGSLVWSNTSAFGFGEITDVAASGETLAVVGEGPDGGNAVAAFNANSGDRRWVATPHSDTPIGVDIDGRTVVSGGFDDEVVVSDPTTGRERFRHPLHADAILGAAVQGTLLASGDTNGNVIAAENGPNLQDPSPTEGQFDDSVPLEVTVADTGGDAYTVRFVNASSGADIDSQTVSSDGEVSTRWDIDGREPAPWYAVIEESGTEVDRTREFELNIPKTLEIRNETNPSELVTTNAEIAVQFFSDDSVEERSTTDGTIDLEGLPADEPLVVLANADGYFERTIIVENIFQQQRIYLLDQNVSSSTIRFQLEDQTGRFPSDSTTLRIQKPITEEGKTTFQTVASDRFDAGGSLITELETGQRYRLEVENEAGETRALGSYTVSGDATEPLPIGEIVIAGDARDGGVAAQASLQNPPPDAAHGKEVRMILVDRERLTDNFTVRIVNESGTVIRPETTQTGPFGRWAETYPVTDSTWTDNETLYVQYTISRNGEVIEIERPVGDLPDLAEDWAIDSRVLELMGLVGIVALMGFVVIAAPSLAAIVGVLFATILTLLGIVNIPGVALGVAGSVAILYRLGEPGQ
jgi:outer membrane protein assembly factor BamB